MSTPPQPVVYWVKVSTDPASDEQVPEVRLQLEMAPDWPGTPWEEIAADLRRSIMDAAVAMAQTAAHDVPVYAPGRLEPVGRLRKPRT